MLPHAWHENKSTLLLDMTNGSMHTCTGAGRELPLNLRVKGL